MANLIFALPVAIREGRFGSYTDLVSLIRLNQYPECWYDQVDPYSDNCYLHIVSNEEIANGYDHPTARCILWDFEHRTETYPRLAGFAEYWHMDAAQARQHGVRYVPLGGDARLKLDTPPDDREPYDVAYMAYMTHRREHIRQQLLASGLRIADNAWGEERHQKLLHSTAYLHVHQLQDAPGVPALRMVVAAAYGLPVISEQFADAGMFAGFAMEYGNVVEAVKVHARTDDTTYYLNRTAGNALYEFLCKNFTFKRGIEQYI